VRSSSSGKLSGPGRLWWSAGGGGLLFRVRCSSWRNVGDGGSGEWRNWPGRTGCPPKTASAGQKDVFSIHAVLMPSRTQVSPSCAGPQRILKSAVKSLHGAVCLGMIGSGLQMIDVEEGAQCRPQRRSELRASIAGDGCWQAKPLDPPMKEPGCAVGGGHGGERDCFQASGSSGPGL
jgi:hypothetical protein